MSPIRFPIEDDGFRIEINHEIERLLRLRNFQTGHVDGVQVDFK